MMPVEGFEALALACPETVTLELSNGSGRSCGRTAHAGCGSAELATAAPGRTAPWPEWAASPGTVSGRARSTSS